MSQARSGAIPLAPSLDTDIEIDKADKKQQPLNKRVFLLSLQAIINALIIGVLAKLLVGLIDLITNIAFYGRFSLHSASPAGNHLGLFVILIPVLGGLIIGVMARFGSAAIRGHGIPEAMEQVLVNESKIKPIITFLKPVSAAISIGTGGPFGAEGPIIATGGAFGSFTGQIMRITANERKIILSAGACAGMSVIFGTPLAALLLAIELLLFEFSPRSIIPVALACVTGAAMHYALFGTDPAFAISAIPEPGSAAMVTYVVLGLLIGIVAVLVSKAVYLVEDLFEKLPIHWMWWPAIGAVAVGVVGYFAPLTLGVGYENITHLLTGTLSYQLLFTLCFLKFLSWVISLGSGTSGGTLAPLLTMGGATGGLLGIAILHFFPGSGINLPTAVLIGMAAMFAGASRALLTSVVFLLESTMQPHGLLPLLGACTASYCVSFFLMKGSIMTEKIERRGIYTPHSYEPDILQKLSVKDVQNEEGILLSADNTIKQAREWIKQNAAEQGQNMAFVVVDQLDSYMGTISRTSLFSKVYEDDMPVSSAINENSPHIYEENRLSLAIDIMAKYNTDILAVVTHGVQKKVTGILTHKEIFTAYHKRRNEDELYQQAISVKRNSMKIMLKGKQLLNR